MRLNACIIYNVLESMLCGKLFRLMGVIASGVLVSLSIMKNAEAACPIVITMSAPTIININPSVPVGSIVGKISQAYNASDTCNQFTVGDYIHFIVKGVGIPNGNLYPTSIPGLSYRGHFEVHQGSLAAGLGGYWPVDTFYFVGQKEYGAYGIIPYIEFVKTGPLQGGTLLPQVLARYTIGGVPYIDVQLGNATTIAPTTPACTVTRSVITVPLPDVSQSVLNRAKATAGDTGFTIPLTCSTATRISLAISGNTADSTQGVFTNTNTGNAANVGIQILKNGTPVSTNSGSYIDIGSVNGPLNVPMTARYYALTDSVPTGAVNAVVYASIVYN